MEIGTVRERLRDHYCSRAAISEAERGESQEAMEHRDYASSPGAEGDNYDSAILR